MFVCFILLFLLILFYYCHYFCHDMKFPLICVVFPNTGAFFSFIIIIFLMFHFKLFWFSYYRFGIHSSLNPVFLFLQRFILNHVKHWGELFVKNEHKKKNKISSKKIIVDNHLSVVMAFQFLYMYGESQTWYFICISFFASLSHYF